MHHAVALKSANYKQSHLFQSLNFFVSTLSLHGIEAAARCFDSQYSSVYTPREVEEYNNVKCTVILKLLRFLSVLLKFYPQEAFDVRRNCCLFVACLRKSIIFVYCSLSLRASGVRHSSRWSLPVLSGPPPLASTLEMWM